METRTTHVNVQYNTKTTEIRTDSSYRKLKGNKQQLIGSYHIYMTTTTNTYISTTLTQSTLNHLLSKSQDPTSPLQGQMSGDIGMKLVHPKPYLSAPQGKRFGDTGMKKENGLGTLEWKRKMVWGHWNEFSPPQTPPFHNDKGKGCGDNGMSNVLSNSMPWLSSLGSHDYRTKQ